MLKICFLVGVGVPFSENAVSVYWFLYDAINNTIRENRANQHEHHTQQSQKPRHRQEHTKKPDFEPHNSHNTYQAEQARREAEARQYREQQRQANEKHKTKDEQAQNRGNQTQQEPPPRQPTKEPTRPETKRTYEQILGLPPNWTQEDLKTAYKREAGRTHPDRWIGKPEIIIQEMEKEYKAIQEAYKKLRKE